MSSRGTVGFKDRGRALELPAGRDLTGESGRSPVGRARLRYNAVANQLEASLSGATYEALTTSGGGGGGTVEDIATLSALDDTTYDDGTNVAVASVRDMFELDTDSMLAVDGITVAATASGTGRWVRRQFASEVWAQQTTWFVSTAGNDENDGATSGSPIATWAELARRVGDLEMPQATTVDILTDLAEDIFKLRGKHPNGLTVRGSTTVVDSGTFTGSQAWDSTVTPVQPGEMTDTSQDFSAHVGRRLVATSGAAAGNGAWVLTAGPGAAGNDVARTSQWYNPDTFNTDTPAIGDDYDVQTRTVMTGRWDFGTDDLLANGFVVFEDLDLSAGAATLSPLAGDGQVVFNRCRIQQPAGGSNLFMMGGQVEFGGSLFHECEFGMKSGRSFCQLFATALLDSSIELDQGARLLAWFNCPAQRVGGGVNAGRDMFVLRRASFLELAPFATPVGNSVGAFDLGASGQTLARLFSGSQARRDTSSRFWTIDQGLGTWGMRIEAMGLVTWPAGTTAADAFNFDTVAGGSEIQLGATTTDAATLGAAGAIDAATNAAAIQRPF